MNGVSHLFRTQTSSSLVHSVFSRTEILEVEKRRHRPRERETTVQVGGEHTEHILFGPSICFCEAARDIARKISLGRIEMLEELVWESNLVFDGIYDRRVRWCFFFSLLIICISAFEFNFVFSFSLSAFVEFQAFKICISDGCVCVVACSIWSWTRAIEEYCDKSTSVVIKPKGSRQQLSRGKCQQHLMSFLANEY